MLFLGNTTGSGWLDDLSEVTTAKEAVLEFEPGLSNKTLHDFTHNPALPQADLDTLKVGFFVSQFICVTLLSSCVIKITAQNIAKRVKLMSK